MYVLYFLSDFGWRLAVMGSRLGREMKIELRGWRVDCSGSLGEDWGFLEWV